LPGGTEKRGADRGDKAVVGVGRDEFDAAKSQAVGRVAEESQPAGAVFGSDDVQAEKLAAP